MTSADTNWLNSMLPKLAGQLFSPKATKLNMYVILAEIVLKESPRNV